MRPSERSAFGSSKNSLAFIIPIVRIKLITTAIFKQTNNKETYEPLPIITQSQKNKRREKDKKKKENEFGKTQQNTTPSSVKVLKKNPKSKTPSLPKKRFRSFLFLDGKLTPFFEPDAPLFLSSWYVGLCPMRKAKKKKKNGMLVF